MRLVKLVIYNPFLLKILAADQGIKPANIWSQGGILQPEVIDVAMWGKWEHIS